jgi:hypothetical protein
MASIGFWVWNFLQQFFQLRDLVDFGADRCNAWRGRASTHPEKEGRAEAINGSLRTERKIDPEPPLRSPGLRDVRDDGEANGRRQNEPC